jgi:uncharacterized protein YdeI (YjbR/CyaY-like superfamily)
VCWDCAQPGCSASIPFHWKRKDFEIGTSPELWNVCTIVKALPVIRFATEKAWELWLEKHHDLSPGIWLKIAKKGMDTDTLTYRDALETALCYGWIDGQKKAFDAQWWLQKFTPRRPGSIWSKINKQKAGRLIVTGRMKPAGYSAIEEAKQNGRWNSAYESQSAITVPRDLSVELRRNAKAAAFFKSLDSANRYAILFRIKNAKKLETRRKRIARFVQMLEEGEKLHP